MHLRACKKYAGDVYLQDIVGVDREGNEVCIEDKIADDARPIEDQVNAKIETRRVYAAIWRVLHGREKDVIKMRYGLDGCEELTQREISKLLDISRSYVSRIEKKALGKLKDVMEETSTNGTTKTNFA